MRIKIKGNHRKKLLDYHTKTLKDKGFSPAQVEKHVAILNAMLDKHPGTELGFDDCLKLISDCVKEGGEEDDI